MDDIRRPTDDTYPDDFEEEDYDDYYEEDDEEEEEVDNYVIDSGNKPWAS